MKSITIDTKSKESPKIRQNPHSKEFVFSFSNIYNIFMNQEEADEVYKSDRNGLLGKIVDLYLEIKRLKERVKTLEEQVSKNSRNSSKPPSTDGPDTPKPKNLREKSDKNPGGQKGHKGISLKQVINPDHIEVHIPENCIGCGSSLCNEDIINIEKRQEFDIPPIHIEVTEHQSQTRKCSLCGILNKGSFPERINAYAQYGPRVQAISSYMMRRHFMPYYRTTEFFRDVFGLSLSQGTLLNINTKCTPLLKEVDTQILQQVIESPVVGFDETSFSLNGDRYWLHVGCTSTLTYYFYHKKRGTEAMNEMGILPGFKGRAIHDFWKPYLTYDCDHGLCNAHKLRELIFLYEEQGQKWAKKMIDSLLVIKNEVDSAKDLGLTHLPEHIIRECLSQYETVLSEGFIENPLPHQPLTNPKKRGRVKKSKSRNLLERLRDYQDQVLAFMIDFQVPFDNNMSERSLRMMKVQQKISGTFRSESGAQSFFRISSYIDTLRKNNINVIEGISRIFTKTAFIPLSHSP